jgi:ABC-type antimicrobial peptide transport system permease subunit
MIVNESMARALWPNEDPIGKRLSYADPKPVWREVVGVVRNVTFPFAATSGTVDTDFQVYQPVSQDVPAVAGILLRTSGLPDAVAPGLKRIVASLDRDVAVVGLSTARTARERTTASFQLLASVLGAFAGLGVALAAVGIFGVVSYTTAQRSGEIGLRMALGARQPEVLWLVLKQGVILTCVGALIGLAGGIGLGRVLAASIPRLPAPEIALVAGTTAMMIVVAVTAMYIPARRASKTSPMLVLRHE